ncbi:MAG: tetratricopeptide repeat protein [Deltaproteobacteria bacterium]|nr:tetratricopeptide repeat protein [Deltaproteobacteria bacterium]
MKRTLFCAALAALLASCSLPKATVVEDPLTPWEHIQLGAAYEKQGKFDLARKEYMEAADKDPAGHMFLGNLLFFKGDYEGAAKHYQKAMKMLPGDYRPKNNLAFTWAAMGIRLREARRLAEEAMDQAPQDRKTECQDTLDLVMEKQAQVR